MTDPSSARQRLNGVLRIENLDGFFLEFEHPSYGMLALPVKHPENLMGGEQVAPPEALEALEEVCRKYAHGNDPASAYTAAKDFSERYPTAHRAYFLMSVFSQKSAGLDACPLYLRQAIAIRPDFQYLAELGRVLGKLGQLDDASVLHEHLFEIREAAPSEQARRRMVQDYLVTLTRAQSGQRMVEVVDLALRELGESAPLQYQAVLGLMIQEDFQAAQDRLEAFKPRLNPAEPIAARFAQMEKILAAKLGSKPGRRDEAVAPHASALRRLNGVLRLETQGLAVAFEQGRLGRLVLPLDHCSVSSVRALRERPTHTQAQLDALIAGCQGHVDRSDLKAAHEAAGAFLKEFPLAAYAHRLQGAYSEGLRDFGGAARHLRKAVAIAPDYGTLSDLGRVLGKSGEAEEAAVVLGHLFSIRTEASSQRQAIAAIVPLLMALAHLKRGDELGVVTQAAITDYGPNEVFEYHAVLSAMLRKDFPAARRRLDAVQGRFRADSPWRGRLMGLADILKTLERPSPRPSQDTGHPAGPGKPWTVQQVKVLEYEVGNRHDPRHLQAGGTRLLQVDANDGYALRWFRPGGSQRSEGRLKQGLGRALIAGLRDAGFPDGLPSSLPAPPGATLAEYRLVVPGHVLKATVYPEGAKNLEGLGRVQELMGRLLNELSSGADGALVVERGPWKDVSA